jgi:hypothetical protein
VGLGKTVQLAMAAMLMELLSLPSARWTGKAWVDENELEYPSDGAKSLGKCPRRNGLVPQGVVVRGLAEAVKQLLSRRYTCVIVDKAHRARRRKVPKVDASADEINERADPNKLMAFLREIGPKTKSMLLATATPVQLHPVEAWDLLHIHVPWQRRCAGWLDAHQPMVSGQRVPGHCYGRCGGADGRCARGLAICARPIAL